MALALVASGFVVPECKAVEYDDEGAVTTADYIADPVAEKSAVVQASYSTGNSGSKLKWRPYRPSPSKSPVVRPAASARPIAEAEQQASFGEPIEGASAMDDPFNDPFNDAAQLTRLVPPANLRDDLLEKPEPKPVPAGKLPTLISQQLAPKSESSQQSEIRGEELEEALAAGPQAGMFNCPSPKDLKPINKISYRITPEKGELPQECGLGGEEFRPRVWQPITFTWKASALCHKPLYFEEVALERYGHTVGLGLQPVVSAAHFFLTVPVLPYKMGLYPPGECMYTLGYYRPGSCAPYMLDPLPISIRAALWEAGAWVGGVAVIP